MDPLGLAILAKVAGTATGGRSLYQTSSGAIKALLPFVLLKMSVYSLPGVTRVVANFNKSLATCT